MNRHLESFQLFHSSTSTSLFTADECCSLQGSWTRWPVRVLSISNDSVILWSRIQATGKVFRVYLYGRKGVNAIHCEKQYSFLSGLLVADILLASYRLMWHRSKWEQLYWSFSPNWVSSIYLQRMEEDWRFPMEDFRRLGNAGCTLPLSAECPEPCRSLYLHLQKHGLIFSWLPWHWQRTRRENPFSAAAELCGPLPTLCLQVVLESPLQITEQSKQSGMNSPGQHGKEGRHSWLLLLRPW